ncbi:hypothetical protein [Haloarchaeobius litoreus]|uniref:Uncharacterized protein n=1 Tax=Haloarchaeobius litoreus TaxID=755306 RepID=A0ABD6DL66_9EURY|nr:hypothetical protein [Haloarchaeobius litoreus]
MSDAELRYVVDHRNPDLFRLRCPSCGQTTERQSRPGENTRICSPCNRLKGVTPLLDLRNNDTPLDLEGRTVVADGGVQMPQAHVAASLFDDAAVALRDGEVDNALEYVDDGLTAIQSGMSPPDVEVAPAEVHADPDEYDGPTFLCSDCEELRPIALATFRRINAHGVCLPFCPECAESDGGDGE